MGRAGAGRGEGFTSPCFSVGWVQSPSVSWPLKWDQAGWVQLQGSRQELKLQYQGHKSLRQTGYGPPPQELGGPQATPGAQALPHERRLQATVPGRPDQGQCTVGTRLLKHVLQLISLRTSEAT